MDYQSIIIGIFIITQTIYGAFKIKSVEMDDFADQGMIATVTMETGSNWISGDLMDKYEFDKNAYLFMYYLGNGNLNFGIIKYNNNYRNYDFSIKHEKFDEAKKLTKVDTLTFLTKYPNFGKNIRFKECWYNVEQMKGENPEKCAQQVSIYTIETDLKNTIENVWYKELLVIIRPAMREAVVVSDDLNEEVRLHFKEDRIALYKSCKENGDIKITDPGDETKFVRTCQWMLQPYSDVFRDEIKGINDDDTISLASWGFVADKNGDDDGEGKSGKSDSIMTIKGKIDIQHIKAGIRYLFTQELDDEYLPQLFQFGYVYNVASLKINALNRIRIKRDIDEFQKLLLLFNKSEYETQFIRDVGKFLESFIKSKFKEIKESGFFGDLSADLKVMIYGAKTN